MLPVAHHAGAGSGRQTGWADPSHRRGPRSAPQAGCGGFQPGAGISVRGRLSPGGAEMGCESAASKLNTNSTHTPAPSGPSALDSDATSTRGVRGQRRTVRREALTGHWQLEGHPLGLPGSRHRSPTWCAPTTHTPRHKPRPVTCTQPGNGGCGGSREWRSQDRGVREKERNAFAQRTLCLSFIH